MRKVSLGIYSTCMISLLAFAPLAIYAPHQASASAIQYTNSFLLYENPTYGIKIEYPAEWGVFEEGFPSTLVVAFDSPVEGDSDAFIEGVDVFVEAVPRDLTLDEYTESQINLLGEFYSDFEIIESGAATLGGNPAHQIVYTGNLEGYDATDKAMEVWTIMDGSVYIVGYYAEPETYATYLPKAEKMIDSFEIEEVAQPETIAGRYVDPDLGLQIDFPEGWSGFEGTEEDEIAVVVFPGFESAGGDFMDPLGSMDLVFMAVIVTDISELLSGPRSVISAGPYCDAPHSGTVTKLNDIKALEIPVECQYDADTERVKSLMYILATKEKAVGIVYWAASGTIYETHLAEFEESLKTLKLENAIDLSDSSVTAPLFGLQLRKETVMVGKNLYDIEVASDSTITDLTFSEQDKQISFRIEEEKGSEDDTEAPTTVYVGYIGKVLEGPYTVTADGSPVDEFMIIEDETTGENSINLRYSPGMNHDDDGPVITIKGTKLVSELPPTEEKEEQGAISIASKQKTKVTVVAVKNNGGDEIFGVQMEIDDGKIRYVKAKGWERDRIDQGAVIVQTADRPLKPGGSLILTLVVDNPTSSFEWTVFDIDGNMMTKIDVNPES